MLNSISLVVPVFNEEKNIRPLYEEIAASLGRNHLEFELIFVNDGSTDRTAAALEECAALDDRVKVVSFRRNFGQTAALQAGFDHARNEIIVAMDGDLQNHPDDIPSILAKLQEGYDVVSGWRKDRKDHKIKRNLVSRVANWLISRISGVHLHDYGCTLKAYRRSVLENVRLYGEMHRFIPIYAKWTGAKVCEVPVGHRPRLSGQSKYGLNRVFKVLLDLVLVKFLMDYNTRPIHIFGATGFFCFAISLVSGLSAVYLRIFENISFIQTPLPLLVVMTFLTGLLCILMGLLAEFLVRIYYESQGKTSYAVKSYINFPGK